MTRRALILRSSAEAEATEAAQWYEQEASGLGKGFLELVDRKLAEIQENPHLYPLVFQDVRRALLHRFPYGIFFRLRSRKIIVLAIMHLARHPSRWRERR